MAVLGVNDVLWCCIIGASESRPDSKLFRWKRVTRGDCYSRILARESAPLPQVCWVERITCAGVLLTVHLRKDIQLVKSRNELE